MHIGILFTVINIGLIVHAIKTGRFMPWFYVLLFLPGIGAAIYIVVELIPEWTGTRRARNARQRIGRTLNPTGRYRQLTDELAMVDTISNRSALAEECLNLSRFDEALALYADILHKPLGDEPVFMLGKARALFGLGRMEETVACLEELKARWQNYTSFDGHLLYARALEGAGRNDEALEHYELVGRYFPGAEPRVRQAQLLKRLGHDAESRAIAEDVARGLQRAPSHVRRNQREWLSLAQQLARG